MNISDHFSKKLKKQKEYAQPTNNNKISASSALPRRERTPKGVLIYSNTVAFFSAATSRIYSVNAHSGALFCCRVKNFETKSFEKCLNVKLLALRGNDD
jgi:hypothetical protein